MMKAASKPTVRQKSPPLGPLAQGEAKGHGDQANCLWVFRPTLTASKEFLGLRILDNKRQLKGNDLRLEDFGWAGANLPP